MLQKGGFPKLEKARLPWDCDTPKNYKLALISPGKKNLNTIRKTEYKLADTRKEGRQ